MVFHGWGGVIGGVSLLGVICAQVQEKSVPSVRAICTDGRGGSGVDAGAALLQVKHPSRRRNISTNRKVNCFGSVVEDSTLVLDVEGTV